MDLLVFMGVDFSDVVSISFVIIKGLMIGVSVIFLLSGLDDFFIDLCFWMRCLYRWLFITSKYPRLSEQQLREKPEQAIAVMIPAWQESEVICPMLQNTLRSLEYENYHIFVGTYPNDPDTQREVKKVRKNADNVHCVVCRDDGPTNKADCLNWIYQGIKTLGKEHNIRFEIFIMQDCEDVIHPLCYKVFNYLMPRKDMIQLPVLSLKTKWYEFTAGHYIDEFSQLHYKDLVVREMLNRSLPAAGVGCAFSRRALNVIAKDNNNQLFSTNSLTEDYDFGFRLKEYGFKQIFAKILITRTTTRRGFWTKKNRRVESKELICIREYFPAMFGAAVRQKSRWVLGIALQGWVNLGWKGGFWTKYMLFRDRKALITNLVNVLGYLVLFIVLSYWTAIWLYPDAYNYPSLLEQGSWLWYVILANAGFLVLRILHRAFCVSQFYDWRQGILSIPRMVVGNLVNFLATGRAILQFTNHLRTGKRIAWDKTTHNYPSEDVLQGFRRKLGDLLLERQLITVEQLNHALHQQRESKNHQLLGLILTRMGVLRNGDLDQVLAAQ